MLVCVPTSNDAGLDGLVHDHFGSAPYFTLVDTETGDVQVLANNNDKHAHGTCHPMTQLNRYRIDALVCRGMGRRAVEALNAEGVRTLVSEAGNVKDAIDAVKDGTAKDIDPQTACRGHGQRQDHGDVKLGSGRDLASAGGRGQGRGCGRGGCGQQRGGRG